MNAGVPPLAALVLAGLAQACAPVPAAGGGIVSTNPCADAMLVQLAPPQRIAAISAFSRDPAAASIAPEVARRFHTVAGTAEEVIALRPALVLTSSLTPAATRAAYAKAGLRTLVLDSPTSIAASEAQVRTLAAAVGTPAAGEAMVQRIEVAVAQAAPPRDGRRPAALLFIGGDLANGSGTLLDELLRRAGFRNAAADYGLRYTAPVPSETIAARPPDLVIAPQDGRSAALRRRVLARLGDTTREAAMPRRLMNCGGPVIVPALQRLAQIRRGAAS